VKNGAPLIHVLLLTAAGAWLSGAANAQDAPPAERASDSVLVGDPADSFSGLRQLNAAAGSRNQQLNLGAIALGDLAIATASVAQIADNPALGDDRAASVAIADGAFADSHGLTAVNAAAGSDNQQANVALIAIGLEGRVIADAVLMQTRASHEPSEEQGATAPERSVTLGHGAFANSSGIIQVSLIGGARNSSANLAVLTVQAGND
jgi:hypothetical protein